MGFFDELTDFSTNTYVTDYDLAVDVGMPTATRIVLFHDDQHLVTLSRFSVNRVVVSFDVRVERRPYERDLDHRALGDFAFDDPPPDPADPRRFRLGVQFSDGLKITNLDPIALDNNDWDGPRLVATTMGVGGNPEEGWRCDGQFHLAPIPPPGRTTFACEWPILDIPECLVHLDGQVFQDAASQTIARWSGLK